MLIETCLVSMLLVVQQAPQPPEPPESEPAVSREVEILSAANDATREIDAVRYHASFRGTGSLAGSRPVAEGDVIKGHAEGDSHMRIAGSGWFFDPDRESRGKTRFKAGYGGETLILLDVDRKIAFEGNPASARRVLGPVFRLDMIEYGHPTPFQDELNGRVQRYEGRTLIGDVLCEVIYVEYNITPAQSARWYFGVEDHLPRQVERLAEEDGLPGAAVLTLTSVEVDPELEDDAFEIEIPDDFTRRDASGPTPVGGGLGIGR